MPDKKILNVLELSAFKINRWMVGYEGDKPFITPRTKKKEA